MTKRQKSKFSHLYPDAFRGPWELSFHFAELNGVAECVGLDVRSFKGTGQPISRDLHPLTASFMRSLPVGQLISDQALFARHLLREVAAGTKGFNPAARSAAESAVPAFERRRSKTGKVRNHWTKERLQEVAEVYTEALRLKQRPTKAVAESFNLSSSMAAKLVGRCREAGLLGRTTPGKAGGIKPPRKRRRK